MGQTDPYYADVVAALRATPGVRVTHEYPGDSAARLECDSLEAKLAACNTIARIGSEHPAVQTFANRLNGPTVDESGFLDAVTTFVRDSCRWNDEPGETFRAPWATLEQRKGDCDCMAILAASIAMAGGSNAEVAAMPTSGGDYHAAALYLPKSGGHRWGETTVPGYAPGRDPRELIEQIHQRDRGATMAGIPTYPFPQGGDPTKLKPGQQFSPTSPAGGLPPGFLKFTPKSGPSVIVPIHRLHIPDGAYINPNPGPSGAPSGEPSAAAPPGTTTTNVSTTLNVPAVALALGMSAAVGAGAGALAGGKGRRAKGALIGAGVTSLASGIGIAAAALWALAKP